MTKRDVGIAAALLAAIALTLVANHWFRDRARSARRPSAPASSERAAPAAPASLTAVEPVARDRQAAVATAAESSDVEVPALPVGAEPAAAPPMAVTGRIFGRVLGPDGQPAEGRKVRLLRTRSGTVQNAVTDADGVYDARELDAGNYHVSTQPTSEELQRAGADSPSAALIWLAQESVDLAPGAEAQVDLGFPPERPICVHGRLTGRAPPGGVTLQWVPEGEMGYNRARYARSRDDRTYEVTLAEPGPYRISVIVASTRVDSAVEIPDTASFTHDIELPQGGLRITVTDMAGTPAIGGSASLVPRAGIPPFPGMSSSTFWRRVQHEGRIEYDYLPAGEWSLAVHDAFVVKGAPLAAAHQLVHMGDSIEPVELTVALAPGLSAGGTVVDDAGAPVRNVDVHVFDAQGEPLAPLKAARSDKDGAFRFAGLAPGAYSAFGLLGDRCTQPVTFTLRLDDAASPEPRANQDPPSIALALGPAARLTVDRARLGASAWIDVRDERGRGHGGLLDWNLFSGAHGRGASATSSWYQLPAGNYTVRALGAAGVLAERTVALLAGEAARIAF